MDHRVHDLLRTAERLQQHDTGLALGAYRSALDLMPDNPELLFEFGQACVRHADTLRERRYREQLQHEGRTAMARAEARLQRSRGQLG